MGTTGLTIRGDGGRDLQGAGALPTARLLRHRPRRRVAALQEASDLVSRRGSSTRPVMRLGQLSACGRLHDRGHRGGCPARSPRCEEMSSPRACRIAQSCRDGQPGSPPQGSVPAWTAAPRSSLMAPIPRLLTDGDVSMSDLPLGDVRPWMADRRLSHGIAMACRPALPSPWADPWLGVMHRGRPHEGPDHFISFRRGMPRDPVDAPPGFSFGRRYRRRDGRHGGATSGRSAPLDCAQPPSSSIVRTCRTPSTGSSPSCRRRAARGSSLDDGRPPATPASPEVAFCTMPPGGHAPGAAIERDCGP